VEDAEEENDQMATTGGDIAKITEEYRQKDKEVKKNCKMDKQQWINQKASEAEEAAEVGNTKALYQIVKELAGSNTSWPPIMQKDGKYATTHDEQITRWQEHFSSVLNCPEPEMLHGFEDDIEEQDIPIIDVNEGPMTEAEIIQAIKHLKNGKAAGTDGIQPELLKHAELIVPCLTNLFSMVWQNKEVPTEWRNGIIVPLPKKGDLSDCNNWWGITLLSVPGKAFASVVLSRLRRCVVTYLRQEQAGFRPGRSCNDRIFALRQIIKKVTAWQIPVMINFVDFRKAFDCIHRPSLWLILRQCGIPDSIVAIIQSLYKSSKSRIKLNGMTGDWFDVVTGVRQGCILSPLLFAIVMDWIMKKSLRNYKGGLEWTGGSRLCDLDFADDIALNRDLTDRHATVNT